MVENILGDLRQQRLKAKRAWKTLFRKGGTLGIWSYILTDEKLKEVLPQYTPKEARLYLKEKSKHFMVGAARADEHRQNLEAQISLLAKGSIRKKTKVKRR